jgi:RND family efflux transporter MFP subunit
MRWKCTGVRGVVVSLLAAAVCAAAAAEPLMPAPQLDGGGLDCLIEPKKSVVVSAPVIGVVSEVLVERGDFVEEGQVLARLESRIERASVALAKARAEAEAELKGSEARFEFEVRRLERNQNLHQKGVVSDLELDEVESARLLAEASVLQARENRDLAVLELGRAEAALERRTIVSPVKGVVVKVILTQGEYADPPHVIELAQTDPLRVEVFAPVMQLGTIEVGMTGKVMPEEPVGGVYEAEVVVVDTVVDAASGTFGVRLELPNPDYSLPAGLRCRVRF